MFDILFTYVSFKKHPAVVFDVPKSIHKCIFVIYVSLSEISVGILYSLLDTSAKIKKYFVLL